MSRRRTTVLTTLTLLAALGFSPLAAAAENSRRAESSALSWLEAAFERTWIFTRDLLTPESWRGAETLTAPPPGTNAAGSGPGGCPASGCGEAGPDSDPDG